MEVDNIVFVNPVHIGDILKIKAKVMYVHERYVCIKVELKKVRLEDY